MGGSILNIRAPESSPLRDSTRRPAMFLRRRSPILSLSLACVVTCSFSPGRVTRANRVITLYTRREVQFVYCPEDGTISAATLRRRFFFPPFTQPPLRVRRRRSGNNIVKVAVTPKTTKCRLSHRTLQAATAKYRRGGPPAVIARHSSPRERRRCVHRHYTRGGGCAAIRPCSTSCYFFRHFCNRPLSCTLFRARRGERTGTL